MVIVQPAPPTLLWGETHDKHRFELYAHLSPTTGALLAYTLRVDGLVELRQNNDAGAMRKIEEYLLQTYDFSVARNTRL